MNEVWKTCTGAPYEVSNMGNIRRKGSSINRKAIPIKNGYLTVMFSINGEVSCRYIHRLVADAFIDNPNKLPEVNHINRNKHDNRVENLEWCSRLYNEQHAIGKDIVVCTKEGVFLKHFSSLRECERFYHYGHKSLNIYIDSEKIRDSKLFYTYNKYLELNK